MAAGAYTMVWDVTGIVRTSENRALSSDLGAGVPTPRGVCRADGALARAVERLIQVRQRPFDDSRYDVLVRFFLCRFSFILWLGLMRAWVF